jgi:hypothetical protein
MTHAPAREPDFPLTADERELLNTINFDALALDGYEDARRNGDAVCALMKSLIARKAIADVRRKYFTDPHSYPGGRGHSRQQDFERNGCSGDEILRHPHFLEFLRYFLYGADLPAPVIEEYREAVRRWGNVTSGDVVPLGKLARQLARAGRMKAHEASEEFHKLALDCGLWHSYASHIRDAVRQMR